MYATPADLLDEITRRYRERDLRSQPALDEFSGTDFLEKQATYLVWYRVKWQLGKLGAKFGDRVTILSAVAVELHDRHNSTAGEQRSPFSRSTNGFHNMLEDLESWAWDRFEWEIHYYAPAEMLNAEYNRIVEMTSRDETK